MLALADALSPEMDDVGGKTAVSLFLSHAPSAQFAPAYVAAEDGYFADEEIDIHFESGNKADVLERIAADDLKFGLASGGQNSGHTTSFA